MTRGYRLVVLTALALGVLALTAAMRGSRAPAPSSVKTSALLAGIPQSGTTLGSPRAPVTVTEFADLECPICAAFAAGPERRLIAGDVRAGRVRLVYRSLATATRDPATFVTQQAAAYAAGAQGRAFQFIDLFYGSQGSEGSPYVTEAYLDGIARAIPGLDYARWRAARAGDAYAAAVRADQRLAASSHLTRTPSLTVSGPRGTAGPLVAPADYATLARAIAAVSTSRTGSTARGS
jgi:protein-disulfide isomerase